MKISNMLIKDCTKNAVLINSKKRILECISNLAHEHHHLDVHEVFEALMAREKLGSTGIGGGIALPHGKIKALVNPIVIFVVSQDPIAFDAIDNQPVDIFCAILLPIEQSQTHLPTLATIAGLLNQKEITRKIRHCESDQALHELLIHVDGESTSS